MQPSTRGVVNMIIVDELYYIFSKPTFDIWALTLVSDFKSAAGLWLADIKSTDRRLKIVKKGTLPQHKGTIESFHKDGFVISLAHVKKMQVDSKDTPVIASLENSQVKVEKKAVAPLVRNPRAYLYQEYPAQIFDIVDIERCSVDRLNALKKGTPNPNLMFGEDMDLMSFHVLKLAFGTNDATQHDVDWFISTEQNLMAANFAENEPALKAASLILPGARELTQEEENEYKKIMIEQIQDDQQADLRIPILAVPFELVSDLRKASWLSSGEAFIQRAQVITACQDWMSKSTTEWFKRASVRRPFVPAKLAHLVKTCWDTYQSWSQTGQLNKEKFKTLGQQVPLPDIEDLGHFLPRCMRKNHNILIKHQRLEFALRARFMSQLAKMGYKDTQIDSLFEGNYVGRKSDWKTIQRSIKKLSLEPRAAACLRLQSIRNCPWVTEDGLTPSEASKACSVQIGFAQPIRHPEQFIKQKIIVNRTVMVAVGELFPNKIVARSIARFVH